MKTAVELTGNCELGPACGMIPVLEFMAGLAVVLFVVGVVLSLVSD